MRFLPCQRSVLTPRLAVEVGYPAHVETAVSLRTDYVPDALPEAIFPLFSIEGSNSFAECSPPSRTPRWSTRGGSSAARFRPDGLRYARHMRSPITVPTLHLHGTLDPACRRRPRAARAGTSRRLTGGRSSTARPTSPTRSALSSSTPIARLAGRPRTRPVSASRDRNRRGGRATRGRGTSSAGRCRERGPRPTDATTRRGSPTTW